MSQPWSRIHFISLQISKIHTWLLPSQGVMMLHSNALVIFWRKNPMALESLVSDLDIYIWPRALFLQMSPLDLLGSQLHGCLWTCRFQDLGLTQSPGDSSLHSGLSLLAPGLWNPRKVGILRQPLPRCGQEILLAVASLICEMDIIHILQAVWEIKVSIEHSMEKDLSSKKSK